MILLEADELLLEQNATSVNIVMCGEFVDVLSTFPHLPAVGLIVVLVRPVDAEGCEEEESEPVGAVTHELHVGVVVHGVVRAGALVVHDVGALPVLELDSIFLIEESRVLMVIVQVVVDLG